MERLALLARLIDFAGLKRRDESGAVTVDWVVLSASVIVIAIIVWNIIEGGIYEGSSVIRGAVLSASNY